MITSVRFLQQSFDQFGRAVANGLRSFSNPSGSTEEDVRPVADVDASSDSNPGRSNPHSPQVKADPGRSVPTDAARAAVDLAIATQNVRAAVTLVRHEDQTVGSLLDVIA